MKIYIIKGDEGTPGYVKQSVKLPKSWGSKPLTEVLKLFAETYNKKNAEAPIDWEEWHLERPKGSTLFPDDLVSAALTEYCDVWFVKGAVKYKGPPPGTAAALEAKEAEERKKREEEAANAEVKPLGADAAQWSVKVKCIELDRGGMDVKSQWKQGDVARVAIEPHATVGMLSNRLGLMVGAHPKHQTIFHPKKPDSPLDPLDKLKDVMASDGVVLELKIKVPLVKKVVEEVSDDEGYLGPEDFPLPSLDFPEECADFERQAELKSQADAVLFDGEPDPLLRALDLYTRAIDLGGPSAQLLCKRADVLLKLKRPAATQADADRALALNPDSAKAYKLRAKARRQLGEYDLASADFGQAQRIDFDDSIVAEQSYVSKRANKLRAKALAELEQQEQAPSA